MRDDLQHRSDFTVDSSADGQRLDTALARALGIGRGQIRRLLEQGLIRINGRTLRSQSKSQVLHSGDSVEILTCDTDAIVAQADLPLTVLAEGDGWIIIDKPAGTPVHPLSPGETGTVLNAVIARYPQVRGVGEGGLRSGVVHRLDVETSGVLIMATSEPAWRRLRKAFETHQTRKLYRAIVLGRLQGEGHECMSLLIARHKPARVKVVPDGTAESRRCDLKWRALEQLQGATLLQVQLGTGFLHQIRVMMAHKGHPVAGDELYRPDNVVDPTHAARQLLHASSIAFEEITGASPDPEDFAKALQQLR